MSTRRFAAIGEILFDVFPDRAVLGGAPGNVCCTMRQFGFDSFLISAVGRDELGDMACRELEERGLALDYIQRVAIPTGQVAVRLDEAGKASYTFASDSAYDYIGWTDALKALAPTLDALVWGSLAQRAGSAETILRFIRSCRPDCIKVFDVNLRAPFYTSEIIRHSVKLADIVKLNEEELPILAGFYGVSPSDLIAKLMMEGVKLVALSRGADGAELHRGSEHHHAPAHPIDIRVDTVGAGDAFTATLISGVLSGWPLDEINRHANRVAAFVCTRRGATPKLPDELLLQNMPRGNSVN